MRTHALIAVIAAILACCCCCMPPVPPGPNQPNINPFMFPANGPQQQQPDFKWFDDFGR